MMTSDSRGHSTMLVIRAQKLNPTSINARLANACFASATPIVTIAGKLGVSRTTVYGWIANGISPHRSKWPAIEQLVIELLAE